MLQGIGGCSEMTGFFGKNRILGFGTNATDSGFSAAFFTSVTKGTGVGAVSVSLAVVYSSHFEEQHSVFGRVNFGTNGCALATDSVLSSATLSDSSEVVVGDTIGCSSFTCLVSVSFGSVGSA